MTNFEYYKDELRDLTENYSCNFVSDTVGEVFKSFSKKYIKNYPSSAVGFIDWLFEENKEPIKLKKWEYDLLNIYSKKIKWDSSSFYAVYVVYELKITANYFKGVKDTSMKLKEILENYEIVSDDYNFGSCEDE